MICIILLWIITRIVAGEIKISKIERTTTFHEILWCSNILNNIRGALAIILREAFFQSIFTHCMPLCWPISAKLNVFHNLWQDFGMVNLLYRSFIAIWLPVPYVYEIGTVTAIVLASPSLSVGHYNDVIMGAMASQITSLTIVYSTVYSGADQRKHQSSASPAFVRGNSPVTGEFPAQMASNTENVSIWWRHHNPSPIPRIIMSLTNRFLVLYDFAYHTIFFNISDEITPLCGLF